MLLINSFIFCGFICMIAQIILDNLKGFVEENKRIEQDVNCDDEYRKILREERLEAEILIQQIEALKW